MQVQSHQRQPHCNRLLSGGEQGLVLGARAVSLRGGESVCSGIMKDGVILQQQPHVHKAIIQLI